MTKSERLLFVMAQSVKYGGGVHSARELAFMLDVKYTRAFTQFLTRCVNRGVIKRLAKDIYESVITPADPMTVLFKIARKLRVRATNYISLESQLSYAGEISQVLFDRLTIMTTGPSGEFRTPYGVLEFTHTKKDINKVKDNLYFDSKIKMWRANIEQAIADLKSCKRNVHMINTEN